METLSKYPNCASCKDISCAAKNLREEELVLLSSGCREVKLEKREIILNEGSEASHIIYLREGLVKESQNQINNLEHILQILKGPTYLGLASLSGDNFNHISYSTLTEARLCFIERNIFKSLLLANPNFSFNILQTVCRDSLNHYHNFVNLNQKHIHGKLADALLYFSNQIFDTNKFVLPLNRTEISSLIGSSRESVSKQLRSYERDGILEISGRNINILEPEKLEKISRFG